MTYYIYHIPGKKIGVTCDLNKRVTKQQGYEPHEYEILEETEDIDHASYVERRFQVEFGYRVDEVPYNKLKCNNKEMKINITEQTTTFPCPVNKLKGQLMDNMGLRWMTEHGECILTSGSVKWILSNVKESMYDNQRCYVYNKAFARFYDNHEQHVDQYNGKCRSGALSPAGMPERMMTCNCVSQFDLIRNWADERGLYENGDTKTQSLKLVEEVGETCRAILKEDYEEITDGIGDCVVVLTNLAELHGVSIEECIEKAYNEIKNRKGKMANGTYVKQ